MDKMTDKALEFATKAHEGQKRKFGGVDYITHPVRVAKIVRSLPDVSDEMVAAAYLHDVVEDCGVKIDEIYTAFGPVVAIYVMWLTKSPDIKKVDYYATLGDAPIQVCTIKLADRLDNVSDLHTADYNFRKYYIKDTRRLMPHIQWANAVLAQEIYAKIEEYS